MGAVIIRAYKSTSGMNILFRPVFPSDQLKMRPWKTPEAERLANEVRSPSQGTFWPVNAGLADDIAIGIARWIGWNTGSVKPGREQL